MKVIRTVLLAGLLAGASLGLTAGGVAAYGHADGPIAQIEFSANCNNPDFFLCYPPELGGFGLGGVWLWIEIDGGTGAVSGDADVAGSGCGHDRAGSGGAFSIRGEFEWWWSATAEGADITFGTYSGGDGYYNVALGPGEAFSFPVTIGHYSFHPAAGVAIETQVAPSGPTS
jgi:hypothetical protein